ncbi:hypothetical protein O181_000905 [Austropuccinia psidii MF-1]|uniref:Uncharacterized protein n=1 Tax=Austropuccinia psidii MF-1 TaxID=1389203 RepID=A0A9Q3B9X8_9BASI|nr:hypothetical protein [Austropuccinia psidii MF-1]
MTSEPGLEPSMSHSNRNQSNSESSDRNLHEQVQEVLSILQRQRLGNADKSTPRSDELLKHPQNIPEGRGNSEILQWMESIPSKPQIKKRKEWHNKKQDSSKEETLVASTRKPQAN